MRRHEVILTRLSASHAVGVGELAALFGVSHETIRRDLKLLAGRGVLAVVHGGAARREAVEPALARRAAENEAGKAAIARLALGLVQDGMVVLLDSGTTTLALTHALRGRQGLTVCTTSLPVASLLGPVPGLHVYLFGGEVDADEEATGGIDVMEALPRFRLDLAFLGGGGLGPDGEVTDYTRAGAELRGRMIAAAAEAWFLLDHSKFGRLTPVRIPGFWKARGIISDAALPGRAATALFRRGIEVRIAAGEAS